MSFNPDPSKQAVEIYFSKKVNVVDHPPLKFNGADVQVCNSHKHLGLVLMDKKLAFDHHLNEKLSKANKGIGLIN